MITVLLLSIIREHPSCDISANNLLAVARGNRLSNTTCLTRDFFKRGE